MINAERLASASLQEITAEMVRVRRDIDDGKLYFSQLAAAVAGFDYWDDGSGTAIEWITFECKVTRNDAADSIAVGEQLSRMPESIQAMRADEIGFAHMPVIARTAKAVGNVFDEKVLLAKAKRVTAGKFYYKAQQYRHSVQPKAYADEQAEQAQRNRLSMSTAKDGCFFIEGQLDPISGAAVRGALEPLARPSGKHDHRDYDQRMADALVEIVTHGGQHNVQLQVTSSIETLLGLTGAQGAEMEFSLPVSSKTVERWACDCSVTRVLMQDLPHLWGSPGRSPGMGPTVSFFGGVFRASPRWTDNDECFGPSGAARHLPINGEECKWQIAKTDGGQVITVKGPD
jgi:hypothetical protein